jgi:hypothetical protein
MQGEAKQLHGDSNMKSKLTRQVPTGLTITALMLGLTTMARAGDPQNASTPPTAPVTTITADPNASLPVPTPTDQWIQPNWTDPGLVLPEVDFDGYPLSDAGNKLRKQFKDAFDMILPGSCDWQNPDDSTPISLDPSQVVMKLHLKNVTATEVFNAMNLVFEAESAPLRWELRMNGTRPLALLRVIPALLRHPMGEKEATLPRKRMVFFVGDLVGDGKTGGMTMEKLFETVKQVYEAAYGDSGMNGDHLKFHQEAQLIIVNATFDKIDFVQHTLAALRDKAHMSKRTAVDSQLTPESQKKSEATSEPDK